MRAALDERVVLLQQFADDDSLTPLERMKALDMLAKYGIGTTTTATDAEGQDAKLTGVLAVPVAQPPADYFAGVAARQAALTHGRQ